MKTTSIAASIAFVLTSNTSPSAQPVEEHITRAAYFARHCRGFSLDLTRGMEVSGVATRSMSNRVVSIGEASEGILPAPPEPEVLAERQQVPASMPSTEDCLRAYDMFGPEGTVIARLLVPDGEPIASVRASRLVARPPPPAPVIPPLRPPDDGVDAR